jgi:hypothetical protein
MKQKFKSHKIKILIAGALLIVTFFVVVWANSNNTGVVETPYSVLPKATVAYKDYDGTSLSFRYLGVYSIRKPAVEQKNANVGQVMFKADTTYEKHLSVEVSNLPGGALAQNSAYNLRLNSPNEYASRSLTVDGVQATIWVKKDGTEQTAMVPRGNRLATFSFVQIGTQSDITPEVDALLATVKWKATP